MRWSSSSAVGGVSAPHVFANSPPIPSERRHNKKLDFIPFMVVRMCAGGIERRTCMMFSLGPAAGAIRRVIPSAKRSSFIFVICFFITAFIFRGMFRFLFARVITVCFLLHLRSYDQCVALVWSNSTVSAEITLSMSSNALTAPLIFAMPRMYCVSRQAPKLGVSSMSCAPI